MADLFVDRLTENPVIAAVKDEAGLSAALASGRIRTVFILFGDILNISGLVARVKDAGKLAMVHADLVEGLAGKEIAVDFLKKTTRADGIITTRQPFARRAGELRFHCILRVFVLDSIALSGMKKLEGLKPDAIEILPGLMPGIIRRLSEETSLPILAGGLIAEKSDVLQALDAGACAISTTNAKLWNI